jgi:hypothetical protein
MIQVGLLTIEQKEEITGQQFAPDSYFYPIQDINDNWVISQEEMNQCCNSQFLWVKDIPLIEYQPKIIEDLF